MIGRLCFLPLQFRPRIAPYGYMLALQRASTALLLPYPTHSHILHPFLAQGIRLRLYVAFQKSCRFDYFCLGPLSSEVFEEGQLQFCGKGLWRSWRC